MNLVSLLRLVGASMIVLALFHVVFWRTLNWNREVKALSPMAACAFAAQTFFIAFVLMGLGLLSLLRPHLLVTHSELARILLCWIVLFWLARLLMQPLAFDRAMKGGPLGRLRIGASLIWALYIAVYGMALLNQYGIVS